MDFAGAGLVSHVHDRALFYFCHTAGHADRNDRFQKFPSDGPFHKIFQHLFCVLKIRNHALPQRADRCQIFGSAPDHLARLFSHRYHLIILLGIDHHHGRFPQNNSLLANIY